MHTISFGRLQGLSATTQMNDAVLDAFEDGVGPLLFQEPVFARGDLMVGSKAAD